MIKRLLAPIHNRIFLVCWILYSAFFATNVVREHYPAFSLIESGTLSVDRYVGFHSDIFVHTDGHAYINSNATCSVLTVVPLVLFDPLLDKIEAYSNNKLRENPSAVAATYRTKYPNRRKMFERVKKAGLDLRFGASTAITSALFMAPLSAWMVVLLFLFLERRGVKRSRALGLTFLFAFGTPLFYRTGHLSHNTIEMYATFGAFLLLFEPPGQPYEPSRLRRIGAGLLCGLTFALDYSGAFPAAVLWFYFVLSRHGSAGIRTAIVEGLEVVAAAMPTVFILLLAQWAQFGDPFTPAQFVMKSANFTNEGLSGIGLPTLEIFLKNLFAPGWGLYTFAPLFLLSLIPVGARDDLVLPKRERRMVAVMIVTFMLFCAGNRYSLMQFNTGFRYFIVLVPFLFLQLVDHLRFVSRRTFVIFAALSIGHSTVLSMTREVNDTERELREEAAAQGVAEYQLDGYIQKMATETPIPVAYRRIATEGPQLPWLKVLSQTSNVSWLRSAWVPTLLLLSVLFGCLGLWRLGGSGESERIPKSRAASG